MDDCRQPWVPLRVATRSWRARPRLERPFRHSRGWPRCIAAAAGAVAIAVTIAACGGALPPPNMHNIAQVQKAIEETLAAKEHLTGTAYCPQIVPVMKGEVFSCVVAVHGHTPLLFTVTEVNNLGAVTYVGQ